MLNIVKKKAKTLKVEHKHPLPSLRSQLPIIVCALLQIFSSIAIMVSWLIKFIASQDFNEIQLLLYSIDYCAQGLTLLGYLHIIYKLAAIEVKGALLPV